MSTDYKGIAERLIGILEAEQGHLLDENLAKAVVAVKLGQYVPNSSGAKPVVYVRPQTPGLISDLAGGLRRNERLMFVISGAVKGTDQEAAYGEAMSLFNNIQNILSHVMVDREQGQWGAARFGWGYSDDDANPEAFGGFESDPGADGAVVHFLIRWSCDFQITRTGALQ